MNALLSTTSAFISGAALGLFVALLFVTLAVFIRPVTIGFKTEKFNIQNRGFRLVEISAKQRLAYLARCGNFDVNSGFELMRRDLSISSDLIALHQRRWFLPHWFLMWQVQRLSAETIYALFKRCVTLSNIPFDIAETVSETATETVETVETVDESSAVVDDDWDYIDTEKKNHPAAPH